MVISKDNTRVMITIPKDLKKKLEETAKKENRTLSNMIVHIINIYLSSPQSLSRSKEDFLNQDQ